MNEVNVLLADNPEFKFVTVLFAPYTGTKTYTYKTTMPIVEGEFAIVQTPSEDYKVVKVVEVLTPFEINFEVSYNYKWLIQKVDFAPYEASLELEKSVLALVNKSKNKRALAQAKEDVLMGLGQECADKVKALVRL